MSDTKIIESNTDMSKFVENLKKEDKRLKKILNIYRLVYLILSIMFIPILILEFNKGGFQMFKISFLYIGIIIFAIFSFISHRNLKIINYADSTVTILKKTIKRYKPFGISTIIALFAFVLIYIGMFFNEKSYLLIKSSDSINAYLKERWISFIEFKFEFGHFFNIISKNPEIILLLIILISITIGVFFWREKYMPLYNNAKLFLKNLEL